MLAAITTNPVTSLSDSASLSVRSATIDVVAKHSSIDGFTDWAYYLCDSETGEFVAAGSGWTRGETSAAGKVRAIEASLTDARRRGIMRAVVRGISQSLTGIITSTDLARSPVLREPLSRLDILRRLFLAVEFEQISVSENKASAVLSAAIESGRAKHGTERVHGSGLVGAAR